MKLLLLSGICLFCFAAKSQIVTGDLSKAQADAIFKNYRGDKQVRSVLRDTVIELMNKDFLANRKKPGVYRLRQDGMPCVVPDTKNIAAMPNAWKGTVTMPYRSKQPAIPNPAKPDNPLETK